MAHGIFRQMLAAHGLDQLVMVESAGICVPAERSRPDVRALRTASARGIDLSDIRSRQIRQRDCGKYDYILVMDNENLRAARELCTGESADKVQLLMRFAPLAERDDVPDPYFSNIAGFERVCDMLETAILGFIEHIKKNDLE